MAKTFTDEDLFGGRYSEAAVAQGRRMDNWIRSGFQDDGLLSDLTGGTSPVTPTQMGEAMSAALNHHDQLKRAGATPGEIEQADSEIEKLLAQARSGGDQPRDPDTGQFASFDGGVRRSGSRRPTPGGHGDTAMDAALLMMQRSVAERGNSARHQWGQSVQDRMTGNT